MKDQKRLSLDELMKDRLEKGLSNYLQGGAVSECGDCLPCENYCHDAEERGG